MDNINRIDKILEEFDRYNTIESLIESLNTTEKKSVNDIINHPGDGTITLQSKVADISYNKQHKKISFTYKESDVITLSLVDIADARGFDFDQSNKNGHTVFTLHL